MEEGSTGRGTVVDFMRMISLLRQLRSLDVSGGHQLWRPGLKSRVSLITIIPYYRGSCLALFVPRM